MSTARINLFSIVFLAAALTAPSITYAHVLRVSGNTGIVMHIDPEDEPLVGTTSAIYLSFTDRADTFSLDTCDCRMLIAPSAQKDRIEETGTVINLSLAKRIDASSISATYTFPAVGIYTVEIVGTPRGGSSFASFKALFDVHLDDVAAQNPGFTLPSPHLVHYILFGLGALFMIGYAIYTKPARGRPQKPEENAGRTS